MSAPEEPTHPSNPNAQPIDLGVVAAIASSAAEAAVNGILATMRGNVAPGTRRAASGPSEPTHDLHTGQRIIKPRTPIEEVLPEGYTRITHTDRDPSLAKDPHTGITPLSGASTRSEAVAIHTTNTTTGRRLGDQFAAKRFNGEHYAVDASGNYRRLLRRFDPETKKIVFTDDGVAIQDLPLVVPGYRPSTFTERRSSKHIEHSATEAMQGFTEADRVASILGPVINSRNMLSERNVRYIMSPTQASEVIAAKVYDENGKYVGPSNDRTVLDKQFSLVELVKKNSFKAGKIRVFNARGDYVGHSDDPDVVRTLRGYNELDVPVRTRHYLATDIPKKEEKRTRKQLKEYLELVEQANKHQRHARHHVEHGEDHDSDDGAHGTGHGGTTPAHPTPPAVPKAPKRYSHGGLGGTPPVAPVAGPRVPRFPRVRHIARRAGTMPSRVVDKVKAEARAERTRVLEAHSDNLWTVAERLEREVELHKEGLDKHGEISKQNLKKAIPRKEKRASKYYRRVDKINRSL